MPHLQLPWLLDRGKELLATRPIRPRSESRGLWVCEETEEYLDPGTFGPAMSLLEIDKQRFGGMFVLNLLLMNIDDQCAGGWHATRIPANTLTGLWADSVVVFAHQRDQVRVDVDIHAAGAKFAYKVGCENLYHKAIATYKDLSPAGYALLHQCKELNWLPRPEAFRQVIQSFGRVDSLVWVTPAKANEILRAAGWHTDDFVKKMRAWMLRQKSLPINTRKALGGRPGRLSEVRQQRGNRKPSRIRPRKPS